MNFETFEPNLTLDSIVKCHWILEVPKDMKVPKQRMISDECIEPQAMILDKLQNHIS